MITLATTLFYRSLRGLRTEFCKILDSPAVQGSFHSRREATGNLLVAFQTLMFSVQIELTYFV